MKDAMPTKPSIALAAAIALAVPLALAGCQDRACPPPGLACGDACVDPLADLANCGACGAACDAGSACQAGACVPIDCGPGRSVCDRACAALDSDPRHCGACGAACAPGQFCSRPAGGAPRCAAACDAGLSACDGACVDLASDRYHCGACATACAAGQGCVAGSCLGLHVACFSTDEVRTVAPDLLTRAAPRPAGDGPVALATLGPDLWAATSLSGSLARLPLDLLAAPTEYPLHGLDFEYVTAHEGLLFVAHSGASTLVVFDPAQARVADEIPLVDDQSPANPRGIAFAGGKAYVSLSGYDAASGQVIAVLDASSLATCTTRAPAGPHCLTRLATLDVRPGADGAAGGLPFPGRSVASGSKVYVALANLKLGTSGYYTDPAGPGRLAVVDSADDSVAYLALPGECGNAGGLAEHGGTLWVACGAPGPAGQGAVGLVPVDAATGVAGGFRAVGLGAPGNVAFCGPWGFVTDQYSGNVLRFEPGGGWPPALDAGVEVCPVPGPGRWAWAADVACTP
jgi:hypothetical protein